MTSFGGLDARDTYFQIAAAAYISGTYASDAASVYDLSSEQTALLDRACQTSYDGR